LHLKYDGPLSNFAFKCNLRHYNKAFDHVSPAFYAMIASTLPVGTARALHPPVFFFFQLNFILTSFITSAQLQLNFSLTST